jgi:polysaccharide pyruvyl transferase WcaK-like protein
MERIIINGFFAKGNCGDEAILQTWYDKLSPYYRIVASIDNDLFINSEFKVSELYNNIDLIQNRRVDIFSEDIKGYIIGGGGLGLGFGIEQLLHSLSWKYNTKKMYLGIIVHDEFFRGGQLSIDINKKIFESFDLISVRDTESKNNLSNYFNIDALQYPDIAFGLDIEETEIKSEKDYIVVVIRDYGRDSKVENIIKWLDKIKTYADENNYDILYLPFDKTDENLINSLGLEIKYDRIYWHPKKVKYLISKSKIVFSLGRFHPLVFGISSGVKSYYINYQESGRDKCYHLLKDCNLIESYLENVNIDNDLRNDDIKEVSNLLNNQIDDFFEILIKKLK